MEIPLIKDYDEAIEISIISRSRLKAEIRKNEITELYLATIKTTDEQPDLSKYPEWIKNDFSDVFLDGLPPGMPPERKVVHEIPLHLVSRNWNYRNFESNVINYYVMGRYPCQQVHMGPLFSLLKRRMVDFVCVSTTEP